MIKIKQPGESIKKTMDDPEKQCRLPQPVIDILNKQIQNEFNNSILYCNCGMWLYKSNMTNGCKAFMKFADEEREHMKKICEYLKERNCKIIPAVTQPQQSDFKSIEEILTLSLQREFRTTADWENIAKVCMMTPCYTTFCCLVKEFLYIQKKEEEEHRDFLRKLELSETTEDKEADNIFSDTLSEISKESVYPKSDY